MPNFFAYAMMAGWPLLATIIYRKYGVERAAILVFIVPYLLLPEKTMIDLPLLPGITKSIMIGLTAYFLLKKHIKNNPFFSDSQPIKFLLILGFLSPIITVINNTESLSFISSVIPGITWWDSVTYLLRYFSLVYAPFIIGYYLLNTQSSQRNILLLLSGAGLVYFIPILWEVRMSPQLHADIYGFFPHDFKQQVRQGGFRPVVFLGHGLVVSAFMISAAIAACTLMRQEPNLKYKSLPIKPAFIALLIGVVLCKSLGGLIIAGFILLILCFTKTKTQVLTALIISFILLSYPITRDAATPALEKVASLIEAKNPERGSSLSYRFNMEAMILEYSKLKGITGWGGFGRNFVHDMQGASISVPDGHWIILFSMYGWLGYISTYGLLAIPILKLKQQLKLKGADDQPYAIGLVLIITATMIDVIPNSSFSNITMLLTGSLAGSILRPKKKQSPEVKTNQGS